MVHVQFGLGQTGDEGLQVAWGAGVDEMLGQGFLPGTAPLPARGGRGAGDRLIGDSGLIVGAGSAPLRGAGLYRDAAPPRGRDQPRRNPALWPAPNGPVAWRHDRPRGDAP
ncbi:hypothetical protein GCM10010255_68110 [Streptomyces coeruleofuscus]|uniref:Uncharacterized protein n=1 Tax=Streptomyces coeruleofuscus TaxID=66879 RepID=A0ABN3J1K2_9ACTN